MEWAEWAAACIKICTNKKYTCKIRTGHIYYAPFLFLIKHMKTELLKQAKRRVPNISVLINMVSKRTRQLIAGERPMIKVDNQQMDLEDISLQEIADGKIMAEIDLSNQE